MEHDRLRIGVSVPFRNLLQAAFVRDMDWWEQNAHTGCGQRAIQTDQATTTSFVDIDNISFTLAAIEGAGENFGNFRPFVAYSLRAYIDVRITALQTATCIIQATIAGVGVPGTPLALTPLGNTRLITADTRAVIAQQWMLYLDRRVQRTITMQIRHTATGGAVPYTAENIDSRVYLQAEMPKFPDPDLMDYSDV